jgi:GNAT superfamily N-acetyltransferase
MNFTIRPEHDESDRLFIRGLNARLCDVIDAPTHSKVEVADFQDRFTASAWSGDLEKSATFIAVDKGGQRLGYINVRESADEIANEKCGYVALLAVAEEAESEGVGRSLLQSAEQWAKAMGYSRLALDVFASNDRGQKFYVKAGYRPETVRVIKRL